MDHQHPEDTLSAALRLADRAIHVAHTHKTHLEQALAEANADLETALRLRAGIAALNATAAHEGTCAAELVPGDVVRWPGDHGDWEKVVAVGTVGDQLVEVETTTDLAGGGLVIPCRVASWWPVDVRLPRPPVEDVEAERAMSEVTR